MYADKYGICTAVSPIPNIQVLTTQSDGEAVGILTFSPASTVSNIERVNPFKQLSETLKTHHEEECEGAFMSLQCPEGTKV